MDVILYWNIMKIKLKTLLQEHLFLSDAKLPDKPNWDKYPKWTKDLKEASGKNFTHIRDGEGSLYKIESKDSVQSGPDIKKDLKL